MKKIFKSFIIISSFLLLITGCSQNNSTPPGTSDNNNILKVVSSFTIIEDIAKEIGQDKIQVHNLVPTGTDPHEYEPLPEDLKQVTNADVLLYNGLNLEGGESGWFFKMIDSTGQSHDNAYSLTERVEPLYLTDDSKNIKEINPHSFINPKVGIKMAEDIRDIFIEKDQANKQYYEKNADLYIERLAEIDRQYKETINNIPEDKRILVTSERAFQYMAKEYGLKEGYIWAIDTEENGSPEQIKSLIQFVLDNNVSVLFVESNVDKRPMETVSRETNIPIASKPIYSDEIGKPGEEVDTYVKYLNYNIKVISNELQ